jgi:hypothetical protein
MTARVIAYARAGRFEMTRGKAALLWSTTNR